MSIFNRNRKPISEEPVYIDGVPYFVLSRTPRGRGGAEYVEAVDAFGNQVLIGEGYRGPYVSQVLATKSDLRTLRDIHPDIAEQLDTDFDNLFATRHGDRYVDVFSAWGQEGRPVFYHSSRWTSDGEYIKSDWERLVWDEERVMRAVDAHREAGDAIEEFSDPETGAAGYHVRWYDRSKRRWHVDEFVRAPDMIRYFAKPMEPHPELKRSGRGKGKASKNRRVRA